MSFINAFSIGVLLVVLGAQVRLRGRILRPARRIFSIVLIVTFFYLVFLSVLQYLAFLEGPIGPVLASQSGTLRFFSYIRFHIWNTYLVSSAASLMFFWGARFLNVRRGGVLFYDDEIWVAMTSFFLVGYPGIFFYGIIMALCMLAGSLFTAFRHGGGERFSAYFFWAPAAIFVILLIHAVLRYEAWWVLFRF